ncbi:MAG TPA: S8 family serine peptidase [bacterium]
MKLAILGLCACAAMLSAVDIHSHGVPVPFTPVPDENATIISFSNGIVFDTRSGEPSLPSRLCIRDAEEYGYYLVQFKGPIYTAWLQDLKNVGIEVIGYIPMYAEIVYASRAQMNSISSKQYVQWTGIFQPAYKLQSELIDGSGTDRVSVQVYTREDINKIVSLVESYGFAVIETVNHELCKSLDITGDLSKLYLVARVPGVHWIQRWSAPEVCNDNAQWVTQTGWQASVPTNPGARRLWYAGIVGQGTVLSSSDTGVRTTHQQFYDAAYPISGPGVFPNHRKIVGYKLYSTAAFGDVGSTYHGTHVNGTIGGNDTLLGSSLYDGTAKWARLYFVDLCDAGGGFTITTNLTAMYDTIHLGRGLPYHILQHSGSWRWYNSSGTYLLQEATTDAYAYANPDFLNIYAAGNEYNAMTIGDPAIAKNCLTIGATQNGTSSNQIASFSSRGPTQDQRMKPNVCAPGDPLMSAYGAGDNGYQSLSGTSMATPATNGSVGLIRQYLLAGFYPDGAADPADSIRYQSAALLRSMAIVSCDPNIGSYTIPDFNIGWGRIDLDSVLFLTGDTRKLIIKDDTIGVTTGVSITDSFMVNSAIPLRVCVVWTDTAAATSANPTLVNDLNVLLTNPGGTYYRGNQYTGGQSTANPGSWDNRNVEECCRVNSPTTGKWKLTITGQTVPNGPMGYAYAVTGDIVPIYVGIEENQQGVTMINTISIRTITNGNIQLQVVLTGDARVNARVIDLSGRVVETITDKTYTTGTHQINHDTHLANGVYFVDVTAGDMHKLEKVVIVK